MSEYSEIWLESLASIAKEAGQAIMAVYDQDVEVELKSDHSPVTQADKNAHEVIVRGLESLSAKIPILSEEGEHQDWGSRQHWNRFWLVDPLDGTKEFIHKNDEFTVNIALIENHQPVLAVVYAPALDKLYLGNGQQAWLEKNAKRQPISAQKKSPPIVVGSRSHPSQELTEYLATLGEHEFVSQGSSLKFCVVAEGIAQSYPRLGPTMAWDTAAGHCIAASAGAVVTQWDDTPLLYNTQESLLNPWFKVEA